MNVTSRLEATLDTLHTDLPLTAQTVVAIPPSLDDLGAPYGSYSSGYTPTTTAPQGMRVYVNGVVYRRRFDPDIQQ